MAETPEKESPSQELRAHMEDMINSREIFIDGNDVVLNIVYEYRISLSRLRTPADLLGWLVHLSEKNWMTARYMGVFISFVAHQNNIKVEHHL